MFSSNDDHKASDVMRTRHSSTAAHGVRGFTRGRNGDGHRSALTPGGHAAVCQHTELAGTGCSCLMKKPAMH